MLTDSTTVIARSQRTGRHDQLELARAADVRIVLDRIDEQLDRVAFFEDRECDRPRQRRQHLHRDLLAEEVFEELISRPRTDGALVVADDVFTGADAAAVFGVETGAAVDASPAAPAGTPTFQSWCQPLMLVPDWPTSEWLERHAVLSSLELPGLAVPGDSPVAGIDHLACP